ncbi:MAG: ROK family transcriptional regulator [Trueperaceae bacterium]|nr:ROK family transcriptional regulator [Trueperaceae bacterium]
MDTQRAILAHLLDRPGSLAELSDATGTSLPTVRRAVHDLERARWVRVVGRAEGTGGRPANRFGIDETTHALVGVHLAHPGMRLLATDLTGTVLDAVEPSDLAELEPEAVHREVLGFLERLRTRMPERRVLGLGVATPGYVDPETGTILTIGRVPNWDNLPLCDRLRGATGLRVAVVNDVDALATAEFTPAEVARPAAYVGFQEGVKFAMFLGGAPYVGPFGNAGLVASDLTPGVDDPDAAQLLTAKGLAEVHARLSRAAGARHRAPSVTVRDLLDGAAAGHRPADEVVARMSVVLGAHIAAFVHLVQPNLLVLGGQLAGAPAEVRKRIEHEARRRLPTLLDNNLRTRPARVVGPGGAAVGATRVWMQRVLADVHDPHPVSAA